MKTTLGLMRIAQRGESDYVFAERLGVGRTRLVMARKAGRLSPELAAIMANAVGLPVLEWIAIAAAESLRPAQRHELLKLLAVEDLVDKITEGFKRLLRMETPRQSRIYATA